MIARSSYKLVSILLFLASSLSLRAGVYEILPDNRVNIYIYIAFLVLSVLYVYFFRYRTRSLRKSNKSLRKKEVEARVVLKQKNLLSSRYKNMEDSLKYAERIQRAMFTKRDDITMMFKESFILQLPKDIVSGDFFWGKKIGDKIFLAAVDCTGHGVPGAFMSLIGLELFRKIIIVNKIHTPAMVLDEMNRSFETLFDNLDDIGLRDGMDLTLCVINTKTGMLEFAGAFNPLYIIRNKEIMEIKGDKIMVGPDLGFVRSGFKNHRMQLEPDDKLYMFSDGYADQFGGPEGKKFKYRRFRHLLLSLCDQPLSAQHDILENSMNEWKGSNEQVDDILVIGVQPMIGTQAEIRTQKNIESQSNIESQKKIEAQTKIEAQAMIKTQTEVA